MKTHQNKRTLPVKSNLQHRTAVRQPISRQASLLFGQRTLDFRTEEGDWLSWLEHYLDMVGVTGSSPVSPIPAVRRLAKISADPRKTVFSWVCLFRCAPVPPRFARLRVGCRNGVQPADCRVSLRRNVRPAFSRTPASGGCQSSETSVFVVVHFKGVRPGGLTPHRSPLSRRLPAIKQKTPLISHVSIVSPSQAGATFGPAAGFTKLGPVLFRNGNRVAQTDPESVPRI